MFEFYNNIISIINDLSARGINIVSIILTILIVHIIKTTFNKFQFYNKKTGSIINIVVGFIISIGFSFIVYVKYLSFYNIAITSILGAGLSVYSREIIDATLKFLKKDK